MSPTESLEKLKSIRHTGHVGAEIASNSPDLSNKALTNKDPWAQHSKLRPRHGAFCHDSVQRSVACRPPMCRSCWPIVGSSLGKGIRSAAQELSRQLLNSISASSEKTRTAVYLSSIFSINTWKKGSRPEIFGQAGMVVQFSVLCSKIALPVSSHLGSRLKA